METSNALLAGIYATELSPSQKVTAPSKNNPGLRSDAILRAVQAEPARTATAPQALPTRTAESDTIAHVVNAKRELNGGDGKATIAQVR